MKLRIPPVKTVKISHCFNVSQEGATQRTSLIFIIVWRKSFGEDDCGVAKGLLEPSGLVARPICAKRV